MLPTALLSITLLAQASQSENPPESLTLNDTSSIAYQWLILQPIGDDLVPYPPKFREGLPGATLHDEGVFLPSPLDLAIGEFQYYCEHQYPLVIKEAITAVQDVERTKCKGVLELQQAHYLRDKTYVEADATAAWTTFDMMLAAGGGVIVGVLSFVIVQAAQ